MFSTKKLSAARNEGLANRQVGKKKKKLKKRKKGKKEKK
jgi:hypothetical protein